MAEKTVFIHGGSVRADGKHDSLWVREVPAKDAPMAHHRAGLQWTASGYGSAIPSRLMVLFNGRWRRVYVAQYGNAGTAYIRAPHGEFMTIKEV